jgi:hypothetical protein
MTQHHSVLSPQSSSLVVRPAEPEEMADFSKIVALSLAMDPRSFEMLRPEWTLCAFEEGQLATCYAAWPMTMRLDGAAVPVAAVTTVSTAPLARRRGHLRAVMETDFRRLREMEGPAIAILHASLAAIYQRYGYAIVSTHHSYRIEPRYLAFALPAQVRGTLRELTREDGGLLNDLYRRYRDPRTGLLHRSRATWAQGPLADPPPGHTLSIIAYEEDGETLGAIVYTTGPGSAPPPEPSQELRVRDLAWLTPAAYRALVAHLARFDLVGATVWPTRCPICSRSRACCGTRRATASSGGWWTCRARWPGGRTARRRRSPSRCWTTCAPGMRGAGGWRPTAARARCAGRRGSRR